MWTEKYRPDSLDEVKGNPVIVERLESWVEDTTVPNLLFAGKQGIGKTTMVTAFAKDKYGDDWTQHFKQLNASDDRGIDVVRDEVKSFAQLSTVSDYQYKIIFLDEADSLTSDAQPALRRIMEDYSDRTRFFLSCNYQSQIIDPIQSRCTVLRVNPLSDDALFEMVKSVADSEGLSYSPDQIEKIVETSDGDARSAVHMLQSVSVDGEVSDDFIDRLIVHVERASVRDIFEEAVSGDVSSAMAMMDSLLMEGADPTTVCHEFEYIVRQSDLPEDAKVKMIDKVAETEWRVLQGSKPQVQFNALLSNLRVARHLSLEPYRRENDE